MLIGGVVSYAAFFLSCHATRENKSRNATPENFKISQKVYVCENAVTWVSHVTYSMGIIVCQ